MFQLATEFLGDESDQMYRELAETMEDNSRLKDAEQVSIQMILPKPNPFLRFHLKTSNQLFLKLLLISHV